jgi:hypothetical protein
VRELQETYIRKVVDTLHDLPSVLWEVANESSSGGMVDPPSPRRWDRPGYPPSRWLDNPPVADGRKVVISDTDHYAPGRGDALWAWKSFLRGHHPILMDFGLIGGVHPSDPSAGGPMSYVAYEPARYAMGEPGASPTG